MKDKLEKRLSQEAREPQMRALALIRKVVKRIYSDVHLEIISRYISNEKDINRWNGLSPEERVEHLPNYLELLKGRWSKDLAIQFCPMHLNQEMKETVLLQILKKAVKREYLKSETADNEFRYRCSVGSFLVSKNIVEKLGSENFVLYDDERGIYYPTKEGRILLAKMGGYASLEQSKGVHSLSQNQRIINAKKAGKKGGAKSLRNKSGIHTQTIQERKELGRKGAQTIGMNPWNQEQINYLISLAVNLEYKHPENHNHRGLPDWKKIRNELNSKYEMNRSIRAVRLTYRRVSRS